MIVHKRSPYALQSASSLIHKRLNVQDGQIVFDAILSSYGPDLDGDIIEPGAFDRWLGQHAANPSLPMLVDHEFDFYIGSWRDLHVDKSLLRSVGHITNSVLNIDPEFRREVRSMDVSLGFTPYPGGVAPIPGAGHLFTSIELIEASLVKRGANTAARVVAD
ncbi:MAG: HK97 family phage prohead protease [Gammaproteobacteria bacterium]|nr:HK97 family phage prohead protease [Gammaproteobacteria bacterium]